MTDTTRRTFESFGYEWTTFDRIMPEDAEFWRRYAKDVPWETLKGCTGLDAGCGKGRFSWFLAPRLAYLVALDGSQAIGAAARNLASNTNVAPVQADLRRAPFRPGSFGFISSLGVLHHLDEPEEGFAGLMDLLAPGGLMLLYLYSRPSSPGFRSAGLRVATTLRHLTVRLPHRTVRYLSAPLAAFLYVAIVLPGRVGETLKARLLAALPLGTYRGRPLRSLWLDTFDRLSAPVEYRYTWADLEPWFPRHGATVLNARDDAGWFVTLVKTVTEA